MRSCTRTTTRPESWRSSTSTRQTPTSSPRRASERRASQGIYLSNIYLSSLLFLPRKVLGRRALQGIYLFNIYLSSIITKKGIGKKGFTRYLSIFYYYQEGYWEGGLYKVSNIYYWHVGLWYRKGGLNRVSIYIHMYVCMYLYNISLVFYRYLLWPRWRS